MTRNIVCYLCPNGCHLAVEYTSTTINKVQNNLCPKGVNFAETEIFSPERTLTTTVKTLHGEFESVSVRSDAPVKRHEITELVKMLSKTTVQAPVQSGQVIASGVGENKVNIIATRTICKAN